MKLNQLTSKIGTTAVCAAFFGILLFTSCSTEEVEIPQDQILELSDHYTFLQNSGFDKSEIEFQKDSETFIIGGDLIISKKEVESYIKRDGLNTKQRRGSFIISKDFARDVKYFIEGEVNSSWRQAIEGAINQFNAIDNSGLRVSITNNRNDADARIFNGYSNQNWVARALLPSSLRRPGSWIEINTKFNSMESGRKLFTIVHEMGHNFGLLHTNLTDGALIEGTPLKDPKSVMNSSVLPWEGFTQFDRVAIRTLYPGNSGGGGGGGGGEEDAIVTVYRDCPFGGASQSYGLGNYNLTDLFAKGTRNDDISSFRVASGYKIIIYSDSNFSGRAASATFSVDCLTDYNWNDIISSMRVVRN